MSLNERAEHNVDNIFEIIEYYKNVYFNQKFPSYNHTMEIIDRIQPPLTTEE